MMDFVVVETAQLPPYKCHVCGAVKGKMIDTNINDDLDRRIYLCKTRCCKRTAQLWGWAPGERMEQLDAAAAELEQSKVENAEKDARIQKLTDDRASLRAQYDAKCVLLEASENKARTLEHQVQIIRDNTIELQSIMAG